MAQAEGKEHRTVSRVTMILELAASEREGVRLSDIAEFLSAPKSSVFGLVKGLVATGYLREVKGQYMIGPAVASLLSVSTPSIVDLARPVMRVIRQRFNETVSLSVKVGASVVYVASEASSHMIRYATPFHERRPLYPTTSGKCFLAFASRSTRLSYLENRFPAEQLQTVLQELAEVERTGLAFNRGGTLPDVSAVASPVFVNGQMVHAMAVAGPTSRIEDRLDDIGEVLKQEIGQLVRNL